VYLFQNKAESLLVLSFTVVNVPPNGGGVYVSPDDECCICVLLGGWLNKSYFLRFTGYVKSLKSRKLMRHRGKATDPQAVCSGT
jgi:hypothetical protein